MYHKDGLKEVEIPDPLEIRKLLKLCAFGKFEISC